MPSSRHQTRNWRVDLGLLADHSVALLQTKHEAGGADVAASCQPKGRLCTANIDCAILQHHLARW